MNVLRKIGEYITNHYKRLIGAFIYGILIIVINNLSRDGFDLLIEYSNGAAIAGFTLVFFGILVAVSDTGALDIFSYTFTAKRINGHRESLYDYSERKKIERKPYHLVFFDYIIVGVLFVIISFILMIFI